MLSFTKNTKQTSLALFHLYNFKRVFYHKMPQFCANISFMFTEKPFVERYKLAKDAGFKAVESGFPFGIPIAEVTEAKTSTNIDQVLINIYTGESQKCNLHILFRYL